jgi:hypothetical protein
MNDIFHLVYTFLKWISKTFGLTYHEVNVIVYFIVIPGCFVFLLGKILKEKYIFRCYLILIFLTIMFLPDFEQFSTNLFQQSVDFLNWFEHLGLNYIQASVVICVFIPILIIVLLFYFSRRNRKHKSISD